MKHICVDVEGLSILPNAVIVTIAAVQFNYENSEVEKFCVNINPREGKALGLDISKDTLDWWRLQKPEAIGAWQHSQIGLGDALDQFSAFCGPEKDTLYYCLGTNYDFPVLESSYRAADRKEPWKYYNLRDLRTIYWIGGIDTRTEPRIGDYHNAIDDCLTQVSWLKKSLGVKDEVR